MASTDEVNVITSTDEKEALDAKEAAQQFMMSKRFSEALNEWTAALRLAKSLETKVQLLEGRSCCYSAYAAYLRALPAAESESSARFDLEPPQLASLALKDAERAVQLRPDSAALHCCKAEAMLAQDDFRGAEAAFVHALSLDATCQRAKKGLGALKQAGTSVGSKRKLDRGLDDFDCVLCSKLLHRPVTTPCGHSFCQDCFARSADHSNRCPMCRRVLHTGRELPITVVLDNIINNAFPEETARRARERRSCTETRDQEAGGEEGAAPVPLSNLPVFVMTPVLPGEIIELNIFEPRYRLMTRRCLEGSRKLAMTCATQDVDTGQQTIPHIVTECEIMDCVVEPDGRLSIKCKGLQRLETLEHWEMDGYRVCKPRRVLLDDQPADADTEKAAVQALVQCTDTLIGTIENEITGATREIRALVRGLMSLLPPRPDPATQGQHEACTWWAAAYSSLKPAHKLRALMMRSTGDRCRFLKEKLDDSKHAARCFIAEAGGQSQCCIM